MSLPVEQVRPLGVQLLPGNDPLDRPTFAVTSGRATPDLSTMLMTPAIASDPYCAAAPSRRISM